jgi:hypothetical protein
MKKMIAVCLLFFCFACKKWATVPPPVTQLGSARIFTDSVTASAAVAGIYDDMISNFSSLCGGELTALAGLQADEFENFSVDPDQAEYAHNTLRASNTSLKDFWGSGYRHIYAANAIIEGLNHSNALPPSVKNQLLGEAKLVRGFCHFYLALYFGHIPFLDTTDYAINQMATQESREMIFEKISRDLSEASALLSFNNDFSGGEKARPNRWAALALLARVKLYTGDWAGAEEASTQVIGSGLYELEGNLDQVFLKNSSEAIWQLAPVTPQMNTWEGNFFILHGEPATSRGQVALYPTLVGSFETGDERRLAWMDSVITATATYYFPYKYKVQTGTALTEYQMVLRLAEQYLIRAEARAMQMNTAGATGDLNMIRHRAGLSDLSAAQSQDECLQAVDNECRHELFCEWGHRWFDLVRRGEAQSILSALKPNWQNTDTLAPIPLTEIQNDQNLRQNPGY